MRRRNEEAAEGDACGFSEGGVGLPMKYWYHFVYNIVEGARKSVGQKVGHIHSGSLSSSTGLEHVVAQGERDENEARGKKRKETEKAGGQYTRRTERGPP
ncbi:hypothetical protein K0M31_005367 [Melipona bicolor]|uniref:Uncharacterized protein n=1 Tax=Melipona bicolor TaxID=60889 RepID=A0AA40FV51_9HYME|nr:hypothetical protein K0M31_005367 [Melipona bicolor]